MKKAKMEQEKEKIVFGLNKNLKKYSEREKEKGKKIQGNSTTGTIP